MLSSDTAQLAALFVESVLYGVYLVTFGYCLQALFRSPSGWKRSDEIKLVPLFVALSLFCAGTINLVFGFYQILDVQEHRASNVRYLGKPWLNIVQVEQVSFNSDLQGLNFTLSDIHYNRRGSHRRWCSGMLNG
jgi:hypothetical protein